MSLELEGDQFEKDFWILFLKDKFPSYKAFWVKHVRPLRGEGVNSFFDEPPMAIGQVPIKLHVAQLNYGILRHLIRSFEIVREIKSAKDFAQYDLFIEGVTRLVGAIDNADELLARFKWPEKYWKDESSESLRKNADNARKEWREHNDILKDIRYYRNRLIHGTPSISLISKNQLYLPKITKENLYLDFRLIFKQPWEDFLPVSSILESLWGDVINYLEDNWKTL